MAELLQVGCPSCRPTNSIKALQVFTLKWSTLLSQSVNAKLDVTGSEANGEENDDEN